MDGVLVDTEEFIAKAAVEMFRREGLDVKDEDFVPFVGKGEDRYLGGVAEKYGFPIDIKKAKGKTYAIYAEMVKGKLSPLPGVMDFIKKARAKALRIAVATSADRIKMEVNLQNAGIPEDIFDATVNGLEIERKKPYPDIFILAAEKIGVKPEECLVVEDAVSGVEAAKRAGAKCLALMTSFTKEELAGADWFANTLADAPDECLEW